MIEYNVLAEDEIPSLLELYKQLNSRDEIVADDNAVKNIWDKITSRNIKYFTAKNDERIVSSCYICIIPNLTRGGRSIGFIENVITDKAYRRKGIGKRIVEMALAYAREQNCYKVILQSGKERTQAHQFYESIGFDGESKRAFEVRFI
ncbi:MAG: GNAT family N-acetyltransferase [Oscillospiraceae bacterium]|jgi:GNAT superfamily N-acetyltransferase|nr:GNAT family N-acetyltransferase [Oscillospiraceae bacterium]